MKRENSQVPTLLVQIAIIATTLLNLANVSLQVLHYYQDTHTPYTYVKKNL